MRAGGATDIGSELWEIVVNDQSKCVAAATG